MVFILKDISGIAILKVFVHEAHDPPVGFFRV